MKSLKLGRTTLATSALLATALAGWSSFSMGQQARPPAGQPQQPGVQPARPAPAQPARPQQAGAPRAEFDQHFDQNVARCLILDNRNEVAAAKIAEKKGRNDEVKDFAQRMEKDHQQFTADLERFAGNFDGGQPARTGAQAGGAAADRNEAAPAAANRNPAGNAAPPRAPQQPGQPAQPAQAGDHSARYMQIRQEIADQCRASLQRELDSKQGKAFDDCYAGMQIGAHMRMVDELTVLSRHVSPEMKPVLDKGLKTAQKHLDEAKQLMKDVNDRQTANTN